MEYLNRYYHAMLEKSVKAENRIIRIDPPVMTGENAVQHKAGSKVQLNQLMFRSWTLAKREPRLSRAKLVQTTIVGVLMMGAFWQVNDYDSKSSV
jgi:hypothetical protein